MLYRIFYDWNGMNSNLFTYINQLLHKAQLSKILIYISPIASIEFFAATYFIVCGYLYYIILSTNKDYKYFQTTAYKMIPVGICYTIFGLTFAALKFGVNLPRPYCSIDPNLLPNIADTSGERCLSSFPSAHTGMALIITYYSWKYLSSFAKLIIVWFVPIIALSRIFLAMHYPADLLYSFLLTLVIIYVSNKVYYKIKSIAIDPILIFIFKILFTNRRQNKI
ncbi:MAG: hypothetical protein DGJ47_001032 [Rickettsiaceae bacterium]